MKLDFSLQYFNFFVLVLSFRLKLTILTNNHRISKDKTIVGEKIKVNLF